MLSLTKTLAYAGMPQDVPKQRQTYRRSYRGPQLEVEAVGDYPERRLWVAVVAFAVTEYIEQLQHIVKLWTANRRPLPREFLNNLRSLRYEIQHEWFARVCELADWDQSRIVMHIRELDRKNGLAEIEFTDEDSLMTRYQIRKLRKRMQNE